MIRHPSARAAMLAAIAFVCLFLPGLAQAGPLDSAGQGQQASRGPTPKEPPPPCTEDCYPKVLFVVC